MFTVDHASQVRTHIPKMLISPEIDNSEAPALVVLFDGPVDLPYTGGPPGPSGPPTGVVCVALPDDQFFYTDVDITGWYP
jgi:hypothetical protein